MRPHGIVVPPPTLDDDLGFGARAEPFEAETFVAEFAVEAFADAILPGLAGSISAVPMPCAAIQDKSFLETNSGPLSLRRRMAHRAR